MRQKTTKVFVDSRYSAGSVRGVDGSNGASILYEIPGGIELGPHARCWVSEFCAVAAWPTIDETNRYQTVVEGGVSRQLTLPLGPYDLNTLITALSEALNAYGTVYTVERFGGQGGSVSQILKITKATGTFMLPQSPLSSIIAFPGTAEGFFQTSSFVDLRRCKNLFLHSPSFGNYNCLAPRGVRTAIAKIPVDAGYGGLVRWQTSGSQHDFVECGVRSLRLLRLELRDADGVLLDLQGTSWSCTLLFSDE
jgi:hypothetical protein